MIFRRRARKNAKASPKKPLILEGVLKKRPGGSGFLIPDDKSQTDVYIPRGSTGSALSNDRVSVQIQENQDKSLKEGRRVRSGRVRSVLRRDKNFALGRFERKGRQAFLKNHNLGEESFWLKNPKNIPVKEGEYIKARILHSPSDKNPRFKGELSENLGALSKEAKDDIKRVMAERGISARFPQEILKHLKKIPNAVLPEEKANRKDLRDKDFVTIDGETAQDFDDAVFVEKQGRLWRLYVAIADVSHYVLPDSALDKEALERGNSSYFPDSCSPMLPEKLSNNLCSLQEGKDRLVLVQEIDFDRRGSPGRADIYPAVIHSRKRLTYKQAQAILEGNSPLEGSYIRPLQTAGELAQTLLNRHARNSGFDFEIPEIQIRLDKNGEPVDISPSQRLFSHKMIEQFMLSANQAVGAFLKKHSQALIYRIHEDPDREKLQVLQRFAGSFGFAGKLNSRETLIRFLSQFKNHRHSSLIHKLTLRAFSQARYSTNNKGHYGLNFKCYTHFTSPIRRYCDLLVHRLIKQALLRDSRPLLPQKEMERRAEWISQKEQNSVQAERQISDIKKARFLKKHLGETFTGYVVSICSFGVFIALKPFDVEGLVRFRDLAGFWAPDEFQLSAVNRRTGQRIRLGDSLRVVIARVDTSSGNVDLDIKKQKGNEIKSSCARPKKSFLKSILRLSSVRAKNRPAKKP